MVVRNQRNATRRARTVRALLCCVVVPIAYVAGAEIGLLLADVNPNVTAVWPPTGIAVVAFLLFGWAAAPGIAAGALLANVVNGAPLATAAAIVVGNTLAPAVAWRLLRRMRTDPSVPTPRDVVGVVVAGGFGAMLVSATLGTASLLLTGQAMLASAPSVWLVWWIGDAMGVVLIVPFAFTAGALVRRVRATFPEGIALLASASVLAYVVFHRLELPLAYLVFPIVLWAVRFGPPGAAAVTLCIAGAAIWGTAAGSGPFGPFSPVTRSIVLQTFNLAVVVFGLGGAAIVEQRAGARTASARAAAEELKLAQKLARVGNWRWDVRSGEVSWSDELYRIYDEDPAMHRPTFERYIELVHPDDRQMVADDIRRTLEELAPFDHECRVVLGSGEIRWIHSFGEAVIDDGEVTGLRGVCQDVTERRLGEDAVRASEHKFRALLESGPDATLVVGADGTILFANTHAGTLFGYEPGALVGRAVDELVDPTVRARHRDHRAGYTRTPKRRPMGAGADLTALHRTGRAIPVDIALAPVRTEDGLVVVVAVRDATERRRAHDALRVAYDRERRAAEELSSLSDLKSAFLAAVSHELRTPLTVLKGVATTLRDRLGQLPQATVEELLARAVDNADRLDTLLQDILDLERIRRGKLDAARAPVRLRRLVAHAVASVPGLGARPLRVDVDDVTAPLDPVKVERILANLLGNVVRHTPPGTPAWIRGRRTPGGVELIVEDAGPGVAPSDRHTIFELFRQGEGHPKGTGVGLALVATFAELHGGRAWVEERAGGGASFHVWLADDDGSAGAEVAQLRPQGIDRDAV